MSFPERRVTKRGSAAGLSKANKEARLVGRKACFVSEAGNRRVEGRAGSCPKADLPSSPPTTLLTISGQEFL